jgi:hypothetical protein
MILYALWPELPPATAFHQWREARLLLEEIERIRLGVKHYEARPDFLPDWTLCQAFYCVMGGFTVSPCDQDSANPYKAAYPVNRHQLIRLLRDGYVQKPSISVAEIRDKSKGDALLKTMTVLQALYFASQCITRAALHVPTSLIEITTLAYITCMLPTLFFWWEKPLDILVPTALHVLHWDADATAAITPPSTKGFWHWQSEHRSVAPPLRIRDRVDFDQTWPADWMNWRLIPNWVPCFATGVVVGSMHCIAWNFDFVTKTEQVLWRGSAIVVISLGPIGALGYWKKHRDGGAQTHNAAVTTLNSVMSLIYLCLRMYLFVEVFIEFRAMPVEVYKSVKWVGYLPSWH